MGKESDKCLFWHEQHEEDDDKLIMKMLIDHVTLGSCRGTHCTRNARQDSINFTDLWIGPSSTSIGRADILEGLGSGLRETLISVFRMQSRIEEIPRYNDSVIYRRFSCRMDGCS